MILRAFHGTSYYDKIKKFKKSKTGALGGGLVYFTLDYYNAIGYAEKDYGSGYVYVCDIELNNILVIPDYAEPVEFLLSEGLAKKRMSENTNYCYWIKPSDYNKYKKQGYDSVMYRNEIGLLYPDNIKIIGREYVMMR